MKVKVRIIERYAKTIVVDIDKEAEFEACEKAEDITSRLYVQGTIVLGCDDFSDGYAEAQGVATENDLEMFETYSKDDLEDLNNDGKYLWR